MADHFIRFRRGGNRAAVCFVHGLLGNYKQTWQNFPHLLMEDSRLVHCDVICWGYPTDLAPQKLFGIRFFSRKMPSIRTVARSLHTDLCNEEIGGSYTDLILVGHSMGGLVIMEMVLDKLREPDCDISVLRRVRKIVNFGTPSDGVALPKIARIHPQARNIHCTSDFISSLRRDWIQRVVSASDEDIPGENKMAIPLLAVVGNEDNAVPVRSAEAFHSKVETVSGDHSEIVKPDSRDSSSFQILRRIILAETLPRLIRGAERLIAANMRLVNEAESLIYATGSRSRDSVYLSAIEDRLASDPSIEYWRVLIGPPRRLELVKHLEKVLKIRSADDRSAGKKTVHIAIYENWKVQPEVFLCGTEKTCLSVLPSIDGVGQYSTANVFTGPKYVRAYIDFVKSLYNAGDKIESQQEIDHLRESLRD